MPDTLAQQFQTLVDKLRGNPQNVASFSNDPAGFMAPLGLTIERFNQHIWDVISGRASDGAAAAETVASLTVDAVEAQGPESSSVTTGLHWWGFDIYLPSTVVTLTGGGSAAIGTIAGLIGKGFTAERLGTTLTALIGGGEVTAILAAGIVAKTAELVAMNYAGGNNGIWLPVSWVQVPAMTNPGWVAMYIHPLPGPWHSHK
jgi:hypothetical protein